VSTFTVSFSDYVNVTCRYESELSRWRSGETVPEKEQASAKQLPVATLSVDDITNRRTDSPSSLGGAGLAGLGGIPPSGTPSLSPVPFATPTPAEARAFEEERTKLYQQIDEKVRRKYSLSNYLDIHVVKIIIVCTRINSYTIIH
jgi:hypothetical protein